MQRSGAVIRLPLLVIVASTSLAAADEVIVVEDLRRLREPTYDPATVITLDREEIEDRPALLPDDLLRLLPSVAMFRRSSSLVADPTSQGVNLRGVGPSGVARTVVLRDGIPLNDPFGGWVYWRAVPVHALERVEVQPSGASSIFGNFGLGGAIGLTSRPIADGDVEATLAGGSYETWRGSARVAERLGPIGLELDGELLQSAGFAPIAAYDRGAVDGPAASAHRNLGTRAELVTGAHTLRGFARYFDEDLDAGTELTTAHVRAVTYGASWTFQRRGWRLDAAGFGGDQRFEQTRARVSEDRTTAALASTQATPSQNQGASVAGTHARGAHIVQVGVDLQRVAGTATDRLSPAMTTDTSILERAAGGEQRFLGVFAQDAIRVSERLAATAAARIDVWQNRDGARRLLRADGSVDDMPFADRTEAQLSPRLGVIYRSSDELALRASVYRAFRAPTLNELYRPFQVGSVLTSANADLRAETLWGAELGPQLAVGPFVARATAFYNRLSDPVFNATVPTDDGSLARMRQNLERARVGGAELELAWRPSTRWSTTLAYTFMEARVTRDAAHPELVGKRLAQVPRHRASAALTFDDPRVVTLTLEGRYTSRQFEDDLSMLSMGAYGLVDVLARRHIAHGIAVYGTAQNLLDATYLVGRAGIDTVGAPRTFLVGLSYDRR